MTWFRSIVSERAKDWYVQPLRTGPQILPEAAYLNIHLRSLHIRDVRRGLVRFTPAVHSFVEFQHVEEGTAAVHTFTIPDNLRGIDPNNINRVVISSQRLLGPVPFRGGDVSIDIALFSIETENLLDGIVDIIGDLASAAGVGYVNAARPFVGPIDKAVRILVDASGPGVLEIGLSKDLDALSEGLFLVARAPAADVRGARLVHDAEYRVLRHDGRPFDYPYFTFEIVPTAHRHTWFEIPILRAAHAQLNTVARVGNLAAAKEAFGAFKWATLSSPDLLRHDAKGIVARVEKDLEENLGATLTGTAARAELTPLEDLTIFD